jgi:hypothetical protein
LAIVLNFVAVRAAPCGRHITWNVAWNGAHPASVAVWDTSEHDEHDDSEPVLIVANSAESVELIARHFVGYL